MEDNKLTIKIIVNDKPQEKTFSADERVELVIKEVLPDDKSNNLKDYELKNSSLDLLDPDKSLKDNGVKNNDVLSLTKKDGGGGSRYHFQS